MTETIFPVFIKATSAAISEFEASEYGSYEDANYPTEGHTVPILHRHKRKIEVRSPEEAAILYWANNVRAVWHQATDSDIAAGRDWYANAHRVAHSISRGTEGVEVGAGIIAALSPQCGWKDNVAQARRRPETARGRFKSNTRARLKVANAIHRGEEPLRVLLGLKTRSFFAGIVTAGMTDDVCIDRHAIAVCLGRSASDVERTLDRRVRAHREAYVGYQSAFRIVASETEYSPAQLQAITWVTWRRLKGITD